MFSIEQGVLDCAFALPSSSYCAAQHPHTSKTRHF
jgi:hypothetical protein